MLLVEMSVLMAQAVVTSDQLRCGKTAGGRNVRRWSWMLLLKLWSFSQRDDLCYQMLSDLQEGLGNRVEEKLQGYFLTGGAKRYSYTSNENKHVSL